MARWGSYSRWQMSRDNQDSEADDFDFSNSSEKLNLDFSSSVNAQPESEINEQIGSEIEAGIDRELDEELESR